LVLRRPIAGSHLHSPYKAEAARYELRIIVDCIEMDSVSQERALLEGRIFVGILVPSDRPVLELLHIRLLIKYPVSLALPKSHPHADKQEIPLALLKEEPFIGLNRMYPNTGIGS